MNIKTNVCDLIGHTPLLELRNIEKIENLKSKIFAKIEYLNPTGSIKDRTAYSLIAEAEKKGLLKKDSVIIEPTSGNTGIGLAAIGVSKGYKVIIVLPENFSIERRKMIKAYGAEIALSKAEEGMKGAVDLANKLAKEYPNSFIPSQFDNPDNPLIHYTSTGPEIYEDTDGNIDYLVAGVGTGGTISGVGKYLKQQNKEIQIIAVEPASSPLLSKGETGPHAIQGIGPNFVPSILDRSVIDKIMSITNEDAINYAKYINKSEGILVGISSGAALKAAIDIASKEENKNIVVILPDSGDRYLSTPLFED